ncbi:MAG: mechanosensitive ion channel family protein [Thermoplasmata archaeon]
MIVVPAWSMPYVLAGGILLGTFFIDRLAVFTIDRAMRQSFPQVAAGARRLGSGVVWIIGALLAVQEIGVSVEIILVVVGLFGIAAILALREPLESYGARYFSTAYSPFKLGDSIQIGPHAGKVVEVNAMCTVLLSPEDRLIAIPNGMLLREVLVNLTPEAWKELTIPISLAANVDVAPVESQILKSLGKIRNRLDRRFPPVLLVRSRSSQSTELVVSVWIRRPEERDALLVEVNQRIHDALERGRVRPLVLAPSPAPPPPTGSAPPGSPGAP